MVRRFIPSALVILTFLIAAIFFITATSHSVVSAYEPTPVPLPLPIKTPVEQLGSVDADKVHDALPTQPLTMVIDQPCVNGHAAGYPCNNVDLMAFLPLSDIGGGQASSSWGWTDPDTHKEYALLGRSNGTSFIDITNPKAPIYLGNLPTHTGVSSWRELKTYGYYAFIVSDLNKAHGMQVFDLRQLRSVANPPVQFSESAHYAGFDTGHTITINPATGYAYINGSNTCNGGPHIVDIHDPLHPTFAGCFSADGYTHDSQCVTYHGPDTRYANHELCFNANVDTLNVLDVTDKSNLVQLARQGYIDAGYVHQGWLTDDQQYFLLDDEFDEREFAHTAYTYIWDLRDLTHPQLIGTYHARFRAIDHNQYIVGDRVYQADYRAGLHVLDTTNISDAQLREVAFFDIYPADDSPDFNGAWNVYPFHSNGVVTISGIEQGLYIVKVNPEPNPPPCSHKPSASALESPQQNSSVGKRRVTLTWEANNCASNYKLALREKTGHGKTVIYKVSVTETHLKTERLERGKTYQWTVRACNAWGCSHGTKRSFTVE